MSIFGGSSFVGGGGGGTQGVIRYQVLVDTQKAQQDVNSFKQSLTSVGSPVANATKNLNAFNATVKQTGTGIAPLNTNLNAFNSTMKQTTTQFSSSVNPIKQTGDAMANYQKNITSAGTSQKTLGTQVKDMASKYSTFAVGLGSTVSQVVNLGRQYRDLVDSQIAVDRTARKMSLAQEAVDKTTAKLNALQGKGVTSGKEYENALRDQQQALAQLSIATDVHDEALEAQGDTYMNFAMTVIPTVITAVGTLGSAFKDLGLKGSTFTGILGKMKGGVGSIVSTLVGFVTQLFGVGTAGAAAGVGTTTAAGGINAVGASSKTAALSVKGLAGALGLIAIPLAGLGIFLEIDAMNKRLEQTLNKTSQSIIDSSKSADKGYSQFMKNMRDETKATKDDMAKNIPGIAQLQGGIEGLIGVFPGLKEWLDKTNTAMDEAVTGGKNANKSLAEIALGINLVTDAGKGNVTQTNAVTDAQNKLNEALKDPALKSHQTNIRKAAEAAVEKAKADLEAAKAQSVSTTQIKDYGKTIKFVNPLTGQFTETVLDASAAHKGFGQSSGEVDDALKVNAKNLTNNNDSWSSLGEGMRQNAIDLGIMTGTFEEADPIVAGFGDTAANMAKKLALPKKATSNLTAETLNYRQAFMDTFVNNPAARDTTKEMAANAAAQKEMTAAMEADQKVVSERNKTYMDLVKQLHATYDVTGKNMEQLEGYASQQDSINKQIKGFQQDQEVGYKDVEASILGVAYAHNVNTQAMEDMVRNGEDNVTQLRNMIAETIDYTAALSDMTLNQELVSEGFMAGIIQSEEFFNTLVKGTQQEQTFNAALATGATQLGITSSLLSFSDSKMQELIKTTYEQSQGFRTLSLEAAKSTTFLKDMTLKNAVLNDAMISGTKAANDWVITMIKDTAATKANHAQMVILAKQMGVTGDLTGKTTDEIQLMMKATEGDTEAIKALSDAAKAAAKEFASLADAANQRLTTVLKIKIPDADKELKKMIKDLPKSAQKEIKLNLKFAGNAKAMKENFNTLLQTGAQTSDKTADSIAKDMIDKIDKGFKKGGGEKAFPGLKAQLQAAIASDDTPSALYKIFKDYNWDGVGINIPGAIQKDLDGQPITPTVESDPNTGTQLSRDIQAQMNQNPISVPMTPLSLGTLGTGITNEFAKTLGKTQEITVTANTKPAHNALNALIKRINTISNMQPAPQLNTKPAHSTLSALIKRIDSIGNMKPAPQINQKPAQSAISQIIKRIDSINNMKPAFHINQKPAQNAISDVINRINTINNMKPSVTVKVKYDTSGKPAGVSGGEVLGAERLSERTDITAAESRGFVQPRGTESLQVNLYNYNNDRETLRTFKRELGRQRYTMGI